MKLGDKWLCKNGMVAHIDREFTNGGFSATLRDKKGNCLYDGQGYGYCATYNADGQNSFEPFQVVEKIA
jgi:hypothetical protein